MKKYLKYIAFFSVSFILLIFIELTRTEEIDWTLSFSREDKIPYGSYIIFDLLTNIFPEEEIYTVDYPIYNVLKEETEYMDSISEEDFSDSSIHFPASPAAADEIYENENFPEYISNYIFINDNFSPDKLDLEKLLLFVEQGNNVFASAFWFGSELTDTLKLETKFNFSSVDSIELNFLNKKLEKPENYIYTKNTFNYSFRVKDSLNTTVLGYTNDSLVNFIKVEFGKGNIYLHAFPLAFTNYNILDSLNSDYIFKTLSYLPENSTVMWDEYYKTNKSFMRTPLSFILNQKPLKYAYYLLIFSIFSYIIFAGRRRQRIIPLKRKLTNTTLEFVRTIGRLYYQQKNHKNIAEKKITYFLEQLRNRFNIKTDEINDDVIRRISQKSGVELKEVKNIFNTIKYLDLKIKINEDELKKINNLIESFYNKAGIYGRTN